ncbi:hypothetical protein [Deinococcus arcticus]|uniref:hypothetical protein n=1 Tax=Deinococcus arcticus TaxID=2136176 RepID=UPI0011B220F2|nr:hypothetical protein [Deinococcus arcticus]
MTINALETKAISVLTPISERGRALPTYRQWNDALIEFFTYGAPVGSTIYLNVSDRTLQQIGEQFWGEAPQLDWSADYLAAVRTALVKDGCVFPEMVRGLDKQGRPQGAAFLGVLVLVAARMDSDAEQSISERDYFTRLNDALGTEPTNGQIKRPKHMSTGAEGEEPLWQVWAAYLRSRGYLPTASGGKGAWKYVGYAVSQTLIREPEKRRLFQVFEGRHWGTDPDPELLVSFLRHEDFLPAHVRTLLGRHGLAAEDVQHAVAEVYREWQERRHEDGHDARSAAHRVLSRHLQAGLYRSEHWRTGEVQYTLFPRQPRGLKLLDIQLSLPDGPQTLLVERPGYYAPLGEVTPTHLEAGLQVPLTGHPQLDALSLPARSFWTLRADPDNAGAFASLGRPTVGEHFLLLVRRELREDLLSFREQGLMQWETEQPWEGGWTEFTGVMVTANHWSDVGPVKSRELLDALRPASGISIGVGSGLRVPQLGAWLADAPPVPTVHAFFAEAFLTVSKDGVTLFAETVEPNKPVNVPWAGAGDYELSAEARGQGQVRLVKLLDWAELPAPSASLLGTVTKEWQASGEAYRLTGAQLKSGGTA